MNSLAFDSPLWLIAALPAMAALWRVGRRGRRAALPLPGAGRLASLRAGGWSRAARHTPGVLLGLAAILLAAGLARPQRVRPLPPSATEGTDILLVIDVSKSMLALDFDPDDRLTAAKAAARDFIRMRSSDRIGIVIFAGYARLQCPLTLDHAALLDYLDLVATDLIRADGTAIGDGLGTAVNHLHEAPGASKTVVLLTDGANNSGEIDPMTAARAAAEFGIKVYTIGTGSKGPALLPVIDPVFGRKLIKIPDTLDEPSLSAIARTTGGRYFRAENLSELQGIYGDIDQLEKSAVEGPDRVHRDDLYAWALIPALLALAAEAALSASFLMRLP